MIRSFVSLLQNLLDVTNDYNNSGDPLSASKSEIEFNENLVRKKRNFNTVVYLDPCKKNLEVQKVERGDKIGGFRKTHSECSDLDYKSLKRATPVKKIFKADPVTDKKFKNSPTEKLGAFFSEENDKRTNQEIVEVPMSSREVSRRTSHTSVHNLYQVCPKPHPPLTEKQIRNIQKGPLNHDLIMQEHVNKMRAGMQKLQEVAQKFNCTAKYKEDIDFLVNNVGKAIFKNESKEKLLANSETRL